MAWRPHHLSDLTAQVELLDDDTPSSRAIRRMNDDDGTSAGGERPKATIEDDGSLWLAKLQDRGDAPHLPAREFVVMQMAAELGLRVPRVRFIRHDSHEVFLIERFDRAGDPRRPHGGQRRTGRRGAARWGAIGVVSALNPGAMKSSHSLR